MRGRFQASKREFSETFARPKGGPGSPALDASDLLFNTAEALLAVDREQGIVLWNQGAEALFGFTAEEVLGKSCHEVIGGRDESGCFVCQTRCLDLMMTLRKDLVRTHDLLVRTKAGREVWVSVSTLMVPSRQKELCVLVHLFHDISRQKETERYFEQFLSNMAKLSLPQQADPPSAPSSPHPPLDLTRRQREVLRLLASGASTRVLAKKLGISPATARNHIHQLLAKLGVHSRLEAVTLALRNGLS